MSEIAEIPYLLAFFDKDGTPQNDVTVPHGTTDLFVISHGWNNTQEAAEHLYQDLFKNLAGVAPELLSRKLAIVGVIWPSKKFTELVDAFASQGGAAGMEAAAVADQTLAQKLDKLQELFGPESAASIQKAKGLIGKLETDPAARDEFVSQLVSLVDPGAAHKEDASDKLFSMTGSKMLEKLQVPTPTAPAGGAGVGGATALSGRAPSPMTAAGGAAGLGDFFSGIKAGATRFLNYLTYYEMKARAGTVGKGVGQLLDKLAPTVQRIYLIGHSFGGRLVSAAAMTSTTPKIQSMALLQAAFSHNAFSANFDDSDPARPGSFREVVTRGRVKGPILVTYTPNDTAVGILYPTASRLSGTVASAFGDKDDKFGGIGRNGAQRMSKSEIAAVKKLLPVGGAYGWEAGKFHNLEASDFIKDPNGGDAHGFVTGKEIAWAISRAAT